VGRVSLVTDEEAKNDPLVNVLFEGARALIARVPNAFRVRGNLPQFAVWELALTASLQREGGGGTLDGRTKELIVLKTSMVNQCDYCKAHNTALGEATGLSLEQIDALEGNFQDSPLLSDRDKAVVRWAEAVTLNQAARDKAAFENLKRYFSEPEIIEITWLSAYFNMSNRIHDSLQIDIEMQDEVDLIKNSAVTSESAILDYVSRVVDVLKARANEPERETLRQS
jgi:uncharacterized peroxidase-related enzyme